MKSAYDLWESVSCELKIGQVACSCLHKETGCNKRFGVS